MSKHTDAIDKAKSEDDRFAAIIDAHTRAMAAHCECLGMNAENMWAAILNESPRYTEKDYQLLMVKWGLITEEGKPNV